MNNFFLFSFYFIFFTELDYCICKSLGLGLKLLVFVPLSPQLWACVLPCSVYVVLGVGPRTN